jgi:hypothetical protein
MSQRRVRYDWVPGTQFESSEVHHALPRKRRFPDAARKARRWRALSRGLLSLLREALVETAVLAALSLASKFRFLGPAAAGGVRLEGYSAANPARRRDYERLARPERLPDPILFGFALHRRARRFLLLSQCGDRLEPCG